MEAKKASYPIALMARVLGVSRQGITSGALAARPAAGGRWHRPNSTVWSRVLSRITIALMGLLAW